MRGAVRRRGDDGEGPPRAILVVQLWGIGDVILTTPMLRGIRDHWPGAEITLAAGSEVSAEVVRDSPLVDRVLVAPARTGVRFLLWLLRLRRYRFDLAIVATRQNERLPFLLRSIVGAKAVAADAAGRPSRFARYSRRVRVDDAEHRVSSNIALLELIAGPVPLHAPVFHVRPADERAASDVLATLDLPPGAVLIGANPSSDRAVPQKRYPDAQMLAALTEILDGHSEVHGLVFFGGETFDAREAYAGAHPRLHVVSDLPLRTVAALAGRCAVFLGGDTGLVHVAAARGRPCIVIAGPTRIESTRPLGEEHAIVRTSVALPCMPCYASALYGTCTHVSCMRTLSSGAVAERVRAALARASATAGAGR